MIEVSDSQIDKRQLRALLRAAWKTDLRGSSNPMNAGARSTKFPPIVGVLIMKAIIGAGLAAFTFYVGDAFVAAFFVYTTMTVFLAMTILLEFSNLILSPDEYPIVATRPIGAKTFFAAKLIHLLAYVNILGAVIYFPSAVSVALANNNPALCISFLLGGLLAATTVGMAFVLFYTMMLKIVNRETMQRVLGYSQLALTILIYFGYFVVPRIFGAESLALFREFHSKWLYLAPPAWYAAIARLPAGGITLYDSSSAVLAVVLLYTVYRTTTSRLSLGYAQTLSNTVAQQEQLRTRSKPGIMSRLVLLISSNEDRAVWRLLRKQFKYDNRFKMSILTILPLTALYVYLGISNGEQMINPFRLAMDPETEGMNILLYVAVAMLPFMIALGSSYSESYRSAWVFYTSPADRTRIILATSRFSLTYFCFPFTLLLLGLFTWFFGVFFHALLHSVFIFAILMVMTKLIVLVYPRVPFSQPPKAGQRSFGVFAMLFVAMPLIMVPMIIVSKLGYGGYGGYTLYLAGALLFNFILFRILRVIIPRRTAKLEFTAPV